MSVIGFCSGGRHAFLWACPIQMLDATVDCWGGNVVVNDASRLTTRQLVAASDPSQALCGPLLGLFGNEDTNPSPEHVDRLEAALKHFRKSYDGARHAFNVRYRPQYQ